MSSEQDLLIVGASTRAAAMSAMRAGLRPRCADLFADVDLQALCPVVRVSPDQHPNGLATIIDEDRPGAWMYTGAMENRPSLVEQMACKRPLWGNSAEALRTIRNPFWIARTLARAGLPCPRVEPVDYRPKEQGGWVIKPFHGAAGRGVHLWEKQEAGADRNVYLQEFITGLACAVVFVADDEETRLLGVTEQLIGEPGLHASPFVYCGSIGPLSLPTKCQRTLEEIGTTLATQAGLRGLFGIDFVLRDDIPWVVEVNPRYTASVEVLEFSTGVKAVALHQQVFERAATAESARPSSRNNRVCGKAILFARQDLLFPTDGPWLSALEHSNPGLAMPAFADIPAADEPIGKGRPILTVFAQADSRDNCYRLLQERTKDLDRWLFDR